MSANAIIAKLGLDTKDFQKDLTGSVAQVLKAHTQMMRGAKQQQSATQTLGTSITQAGKAWAMAGIAAITGPILGAVAISSLYDGVKGVRELQKELNKLSSVGNAKFAGIDELNAGIQQSNNLIEQAETHLTSYKSTFMANVSDMVKFYVEAFNDPMGFLTGKVNIGDSNKDIGDSQHAQYQKKLEYEKELTKRTRDRIALEEAKFSGNSKEAELTQAEKRKKEAERQRSKISDPEAVQQHVANTEAQYNLEVEQINKKYDLMEEEVRLQNTLSSLSGSTSTRTIRALQIEIAMLSRRRDARKDLNKEERAALNATINQKSRQLHDANVEREMMSPQEREAEREQERQRKRAERVVLSRQKSREQNASVNSSDEIRKSRMDTAVAGGDSINPFGGKSLKDEINASREKTPLTLPSIAKDHANSISSNFVAGKGNEVGQEIAKLLPILTEIRDKVGTNK